MTRPPYDWSTEQIHAWRRFIETVAIALCLIATGILAALGIWLTIQGNFAGWLCLTLAAALAIVSLAIGHGLDEDQPYVRPPEAWGGYPDEHPDEKIDDGYGNLYRDEDQP